MVIDITVEDHEEPVKEVGRIIKSGRNFLKTYQLTMEIDNTTGEDKLEATQRLEQYLKGRDDRAYVDAWSTLASRQLALGQTEKAVSTYRKVLEISPNMIELFKRRVKKNELPKEILE
jgi:Tfp pilus assembly protein PilF